MRFVGCTGSSGYLVLSCSYTMWVMKVLLMSCKRSLVVRIS